MSAEILSPYSFSCFSVVKIRASAEFSFSTSSFAFLSASALASASSFIFLISASVKPDEASIRIFCSLPVALSLAATCNIPLASISKVTSTCGTPRGAGGIPSRWKRPIVRFCAAIGRSPCNIWISTDGWLSDAVENTSDFLVGIVVLASISLVITPPIVSIPNESGVTSSSNTSLTSPVNTPPCIAAPMATTSSGFTPFDGAFPKNFSTASCMAGIRVEPPTRMISSISEIDNPAPFNADLHGSMVRFIKLSDSCSNLARVNVLTKCLGIPSAAVI